MNIKTVVPYAAILVVGVASLPMIPAVNAGGFNPMNMMNPSKWMGGNKDRYADDYYDDYYGGPYDGGPYGGPGLGGPGWGGPYGGPGWGGYPGGYGAPYGAAPYGGAPYGAAPYGGVPYGAAPYGGTPGYTAPTASEPAPSNQELLDRLEKLEAEQQRLAYPPPPPAPSKDTGSSYAPPDSGSYKFPDSTYQSPQLWR